MKRGKLTTGNQIIWRFLVSYIIILLIPLAIGLFTYHKTLEVMEEEVVTRNMKALEQSREVLERRFHEIDMIIQQLVNTPKVYNYQSVSEPFKGVTTYQTIETVNELYDFKLSNNFIHDYYIYYNYSDLVLSANSTRSFKEFYNGILNDRSRTEDEWKQALTSQYYHRKIWPSQTMYINNQPQSMVIYIQSMGFSRNSRGAVLVFIDNAEIQKLLSGLVLSKDGWAYIADETDQIISYISSDGQEITPISIPVEKQGLIEQEIHSENMMVTYTTSEYNGWTYVVAQPSSMVMNKVNYIQETTVTSIAISLLIGVFIAYYLAYRNSKPLKTIIRNVLERFEGEPLQSKDTYGIIEGTILRLTKNNDELQRKMEEQIPILRLTFFEQLLKGEFTSDKDMERLLKHIGIKMNGHFYTVVLIHLSGFKQAEEKILMELDKSRVLVKEVLHNMLHDNGYIHDVDEDKLAVLYTYNGHMEKPDECKMKLKTMMEHVESVVSKPLHIQITIAIGGIYKEIAGVSRSYEEARKTLYQSIFQNDKNKIIWYDDLPQVKDNYYYPAELEGRLINFVRAGDEAAAIKLLQQLYQENIMEKQLSIPILKLFLYDLIGTTMKIMEHFNKYEESRIKFIETMVYELETMNDLGQIFHTIQKIYVTLCQEMTERKKSRNIELKDSIMEYIYINYSNPDLSLTTVAERFSMSEVYLSHFYKEQTGENFSEYLENLRMNKAKELLLEDSYSINEISNKVGYSTANTFGRAFKRIHGVSATAFKKSNFTV